MKTPPRSSVKRRAPRWLGGALAVGIGLLALGWLALPKPPLLDGVAFSRLVTDRHGQPLRVTLAADGRFRLWTPLAEIAPEFIAATLWQEDRHFGQHPGVNPVAAARSAWAFARGGGRARAGASTVSMQLARLRFGLRTRTWRGKLEQMFRALQLERHYPKARLLEAYLNLAPYGGNVEGVGAASRLYFGKPAGELSRPEGIALSVIPQSPARRTPRAGRENPALNAAHARLHDRLRAAGADLDPAGREFRVTAPPRPFAAPHFTTALSGEVPPTVVGVVRTTLDLDQQQLVERQVGQFLTTHADAGLRNAAALLVDTRTGDVLAHVGSADFSAPGILGQVDNARRPRSPGSALKPFVYALALDQGLIHPRSLVADAPRRFGDYEPENFDRGFAGPLSATEALVRSRNVPAVALAARLRAPGFYDGLRRTGVLLPRPASFYGLTLPLGGAEVTMEDLARLYAALANGGEVRPLRRWRDGAAEARPTTRLCSPEAAFLTLEMLRQTPAPDGAADPACPVAWKTGTSHGFRDAWAAAVFDRFALIVWVGEADGRANPAFVGRTAAGPLLFNVIHALRAAGSAREPAPEDPGGAGLNVRRVELCAVTGGLPTAACRHRLPGWLIPGVSPIAPCAVHREVLLDAATGLRVPTDDGRRALRREVFEFWPADLRTLFRQAGLPRRAPPPFGPGAAFGSLVGASAPGGLRIVSPRPGGTCATRAGDREVPLRAQAEPDAVAVDWFADGVWLGRADPAGTLPWRPAPGVHHLIALDDQGRAATGDVTVEPPYGRNDE